MQLMKKYSMFTIQWYSFDTTTGEARFIYNFDEDVVFEEVLFFAVDGKESFDDNPALRSALLFDLALALWVSYYKLCPTTTVVLACWTLTSSQESFWQDFYCLWLGEFFYANELDPIRPSFSSQKWLPILDDTSFHDPRPWTGKYLLCRWWGKDSLVSASLLRNNNVPFDIWTFGRDYAIHRNTGDILGVDRFVIKRSLSHQLMAMVKEWYYNGHAPITGMIHFVAQFVAYLYGYEWVVFSNERSANFGNTERRWITINHQWSKSFAFESALREYRLDKYSSVAPSFSLLRQWNEVRIAKEFATLKEFFWAFSSCNRNFHIDGRDAQQWCCVCPKCAFVYGVLRPFLSVEAVHTIWWHELYNDDSLVPLFKELWWVDWIKPLECVGTHDEMQYATWLYLQTNPRMTDILVCFVDTILDQRTTDERMALGVRELATYPEHIIPSCFVLD